MWEVSVPSWDEPTNTTPGNDSKKGKGRKKSGGKGDSGNPPSSSADVFQVVSASLHGEAAAEVKRAIEEGSKKKKQRRSSNAMALDAIPAPQGQHKRKANDHDQVPTRLPTTPAKSPRGKQPAGTNNASSPAQGTRRGAPSPARGARRGAPSPAQGASRGTPSPAQGARRGAPSPAQGPRRGAQPPPRASPHKAKEAAAAGTKGTSSGGDAGTEEVKKRKRGLRGGTANRLRKETRAKFAGEGDGKPSRKRARKDAGAQPMAEREEAVATQQSPASTPTKAGKQQQRKKKGSKANTDAHANDATPTKSPKKKKEKKKKKNEKKDNKDNNATTPSQDQQKAGEDAATPTKSPNADGPKGKNKNKKGKKKGDKAAAPEQQSQHSPAKQGQQAKPAKSPDAAAAQKSGKRASNEKTASTVTPQKRQPQGKGDNSNPATPTKSPNAAAAAEEKKKEKTKSPKQTTPQKQKKQEKKQKQAAEGAAAQSPDLDQILLEHLGKTAGPTTPTPAAAAASSPATAEKKGKARKNELLKRMLAEAERRDKQLLEGGAAAGENANDKGTKRKANVAETGKDQSTSPSNKKQKALNKEATKEVAQEAEADPIVSKKPGLSALQQKMQARLAGSRFRWINEQLYTTTGSEALRLVKKDPSVFEEYHLGFARQVELWPENPVDIFIQQLNQMPKTIRVADMGCGDAKIAQSVEQKVHSFDLASPNKWVTACDISKVPLNAKSVDVVIFCLALMGTNLVDFINEAHRILAPKGMLKVAEVKSRFDDVEKFVSALYVLGFDLVSKDEHNKMFVLFDFKKSDRPTGKKANLTLKPCIYKKR